MGNYGVFRIAYALSLGELDEFQELSMTAFFIFLIYTILITLVLMNLVIAILSDKYEEVMAHKLFFVGRARLDKSLSYEKMLIAFSKFFNETTDSEEAKWHYLFVSKALTLDEDEGTQWEGMIGHMVKTFKSQSKNTEA